MQVPLYVVTKMASIKRSSFFVPSIDGYARPVMHWIGYKPHCICLTGLIPFYGLWQMHCQKV
uniref:Uncharacterized protein n=1 Tax=Cannabis sativa TaxID=3483 RepID=A0A803QZ60_CANSA